MQAIEGKHLELSLDAQEVHKLLEKVFRSRHFVHAPKKQRFLQVVCEFYLNGRAQELNEYLIGREVFERDDSYNPAADPIVRVGAHDVRKRLELYYQSEGALDEIKLEIPVGSYEPVFIRKSISSELQSLLPSVEPIVSEQPIPVLINEDKEKESKPHLGEKNKQVVALYGVLLALAITTAILSISNMNLRRQIQESQTPKGIEAYLPVWEPFFRSEDSTLLVLSNPPTYQFINAGDPEIIVKNSIPLPANHISTYSDLLKGRFIGRNNPSPRLSLTIESYTGLGEAVGLHRLTNLFRTFGRDTYIKQSRTISAEDLKNHNLVLLGSVWVNEWSGKLPVGEEFSYSGNATIINHHPAQGEEAEYRSKFDLQTGALEEDYALVTVKPNISNQNTVMILAGIRSPGTEAAAEFMTDKNHLRELNNHLKQLRPQVDAPRYYQALLKIGVENGIPTTISLLSVHEINPSQ